MRVERPAQSNRPEADRMLSGQNLRAVSCQPPQIARERMDVDRRAKDGIEPRGMGIVERGIQASEWTEPRCRAIGQPSEPGPFTATRDEAIGLGAESIPDMLEQALGTEHRVGLVAAEPARLPAG